MHDYSSVALHGWAVWSPIAHQRINRVRWDQPNRRTKSLLLLSPCGCRRCLCICSHLCFVGRTATYCCCRRLVAETNVHTKVDWFLSSLLSVCLPPARFVSWAYTKCKILNNRLVQSTKQILVGHVSPNRVELNFKIFFFFKAHTLIAHTYPPLPGPCFSKLRVF